MTKTIIVSNRLPICVEIKDNNLHCTPSEGGLATGLGSIYKERNNIWIGWPGRTIDIEYQPAVKRSLVDHNMRPLFLTEQDIKEYYLGFSNETLWPACHYFVQLIRFNKDHWDAYRKANRKFADAVLAELEPGDSIWIHDYHLMLLPLMLRKELPNVSIGFFQHIPFPSYEVFRMIPWRKELLDGMLGADYVGFHTYDDTRHFLSSCHRLAGVAYDGNEMIVGNRLVLADSLPMGIDYVKYEQSAKSPKALELMERYQKSLNAEHLILSIDRLDYSKGIPNRLRAFETFLEQNPDYHGKVSLVLVVCPSRDTVESYKDLKEVVDNLVGRINGHYAMMAWTPIHYFYRSFNLPALSALYRMCRVAMITPMRDGMNLVCKEFIASKEDGDGVLILSEMAGSAKELSNALLVNPNDRQEMVDAIKEAIETPKSAAVARMRTLQEGLKGYTIFNWVNFFFANLKEVKKRQEHMALTTIDEKVGHELLQQYDASDNRMIFLDYDGTLVGFNADPSQCAPDDQLVSLLDKLTSDPRNHVVVISGRDRDTLGSWLGSFRIDMIAEHGTCCRTYGGDWVEMEGLDDSWKKQARDTLAFYVDRTPGSFIEEKNHTLVWHYRSVEPGLGSLRSRELVSQLNHELNMKALSILDGNKVIEIKPDTVSKGRAANRWVSAYKPSYVMAAGDDRTDEDTFAALPQGSITIKVGAGHSQANYCVCDYLHLRAFLGELVAEKKTVSFGQQSGGIASKTDCVNAERNVCTFPRQRGKGGYALGNKNKDNSKALIFDTRTQRYKN